MPTERKSGRRSSSGWGKDWRNVRTGCTLTSDPDTEGRGPEDAGDDCDCELLEAIVVESDVVDDG